MFYVFPNDQFTLNHFPPMENSLEAKEERNKININKSLDFFVCIHRNGLALFLGTMLAF